MDVKTFISIETVRYKSNKHKGLTQSTKKSPAAMRNEIEQK